MDERRQRHEPYDGGPLYLGPDLCAQCDTLWPCDFIRADDERRRLREAAAEVLRAFAGETLRLGPGSKGAAIVALRAALDEVKP